MKRLLFIMLLLLLASFSYAHFFDAIKDRSNVVSIENVIKSEFFEKLQKVPEDKMDTFLFENWDPNKVVEFKKGTKIPLKIFLKGEFFHLLTDNYNFPILLIEKDLFLKIKDKKFLFSDDLKSWKEASSFFTGNANISVGSKESLLQMTIGASLNKR